MLPLKRLATVAGLSLGFSLLAPTPASAAECTLVGGLLSSCSSTQPAPAAEPASQPSSSEQPASQPAPAPRGEIGDAPDAAARLLGLVNQERGAAGLAGLEPRAQIASIAAGHSRAMAARRTLWHNDSYFAASTRSSLGAKGLGENVALNGSLEDAHRRLMASPGHRANILNGAFDAVGISVVHDEHGTLYVTQNFVDSQPAAAAAPAKGKAKAKASVRRAGKAKAKASVRRARMGSAKASVRRARMGSVRKAGVRPAVARRA